MPQIPIVSAKIIESVHHTHNPMHQKPVDVPQASPIDAPITARKVHKERKSAPSTSQPSGGKQPLDTNTAPQMTASATNSINSTNQSGRSITSTYTARMAKLKPRQATSDEKKSLLDHDENAHSDSGKRPQ